MKLRIQEIREERGISRAELARAAGVTWAAVSKWEKGRAIPALDKAYRIAEAFGVPVEALRDKKAG